MWGISSPPPSPLSESNRAQTPSLKDPQLSFDSTCERTFVRWASERLGVTSTLRQTSGLTQHWQSAMALASAAACDFFCTGDKSFPQMPTSLWHLAPCHLFHTISLNGHTTLAHHNWGQPWTTAWDHKQRQGGGGGHLGWHTCHSLSPSFTTFISWDLSQCSYIDI